MPSPTIAPPLKFKRSPKARGWYYAETVAGVAYVISQGEFAWYVTVDDKNVARARTFKAAVAAANEHAGAN